VGLFRRKNYESVKSMFDYICGKGNYETIFCGQGELFRAPELKKRTDEYLDIVRKAGREYISTGISNETRSKLNELCILRKYLNKWLMPVGELTKKPAMKLTRVFLPRQMAALYNKGSMTEKTVCWRYVTRIWQNLSNFIGERRQQVLPTAVCRNNKN